MQNLRTIAAALTAVTLASVAAPALASPMDQGAFTYRVGPPSSNPHDQFRTPIKVAKTQPGMANMAMKDCSCPMMQGGAAKPDQAAPAPHG
ncbi:hypothetical protein [Phenylobacterium sp.]|uniref:hypothetical protein n=1 Tax=Phenylobacterium sp. TaxID=1871053 RepID=UPI003983B530